MAKHLILLSKTQKGDAKFIWMPKPVTPFERELKLGYYYTYMYGRGKVRFGRRHSRTSILWQQDAAFAFPVITLEKISYSKREDWKSKEIYCRDHDGKRYKLKLQVFVAACQAGEIWEVTAQGLKAANDRLDFGYKPFALDVTLRPDDGMLGTDCSCGFGGGGSGRKQYSISLTGGGSSNGNIQLARSKYFTNFETFRDHLKTINNIHLAAAFSAFPAKLWGKDKRPRKFTAFLSHVLSVALSEGERHHPVRTALETFLEMNGPRARPPAPPVPEGRPPRPQRRSSQGRTSQRTSGDGTGGAGGRRDSSRDYAIVHK